MKKYFNNTIFIGSIVLIVGCAAGKKMTFENKQIDTDYSSYKTMAVVFHDQRKDVLSGKEKPSFCGHSKSTGQIAYNIQTSSGKPLAEEFTNTVTNSLVKKSIKANSILIDHKSPADSAVVKFKNGEMDRLLFFRINEWEAVSKPKFATIEYLVNYNFDLSVYDKEGNLLISDNVHDTWRQENDDLSTSTKKLQKYADSIFVNQIRGLLTTEKVKLNLQ